MLRYLGKTEPREASQVFCEHDPMYVAVLPRKLFGNCCIKNYSETQANAREFKLLL